MSPSGAGSEASRAVVSGVIDRKDEADAAQYDEIAAGTERMELGELHLCRAALQRLDDGVYGDCRDCGQPIPLARLLAQPQAERCAPCQGEHEQPDHRTAA